VRKLYKKSLNILIKFRSRRGRRGRGRVRGRTSQNPHKRTGAISTIFQSRLKMRLRRTYTTSIS